MKSMMKAERTSGIAMTVAGRSAAAGLCLSWLATAMLGCGAGDDIDVDDGRADIEVDDGAELVTGEEENVGQAAEALSAVGFSTYRGGTGMELGVKPAVDAAGNVYVAGSTPVAGKDRDVFVAKYSSLGSLLWIATFGGTAAEDLRDIAVDAAGNAYVVAKTASYGPAQTILVAKLSSAGSTLLYYSRFGGSGADEPNAIAVDGAGNAYVTGSTSSADFPVTAGAFQSVRRADADAFVTKVSPAGNALVYSTFLGGDGGDYAYDIAVDPFGYAYVVGATIQPNAGWLFPTTFGAFQSSPAGSWDCFVTELIPSGSSLYYSTFLGGSTHDYGYGIAVDGSFNAYVTGRTMSTNFPATPGAFRTTKGGSAFEHDAFAVKLNEPGTAVYYSTFLGTGGANGIAVGSSGKAVVAGAIGLAGFSATSNAFQKQPGGGTDGYLMELNASGTAAPYATFLGGSATDMALGVAVDGSGNAFVAGTTTSTNFPLWSAAQPASGGSYDGFLVKIKP